MFAKKLYIGCVFMTYKYNLFLSISVYFVHIKAYLDLFK